MLYSVSLILTHLLLSFCCVKITESYRSTLESETISDNWKYFKNDKQCFLFHVKCSLCSWDNYIVILVFLLCQKRKTRSYVDKKAMANF